MTPKNFYCFSSITTKNWLNFWKTYCRYFKVAPCNSLILKRKIFLFRFIPIHKVLFILHSSNNTFWCGLRILPIRNWRKRSHFYCSILLFWVRQIELSSFAKLTSSDQGFFSYLKKLNSMEKFSISTQAKITLKMLLQPVEGIFVSYFS